VTRKNLCDHDSLLSPWVRVENDMTASAVLLDFAENHMAACPPLLRGEARKEKEGQAFSAGDGLFLARFLGR
jgi:hypothetical protein